MIRDELGAVVSALSAKFPDRNPSDVERVVADVYAQLVANASVTAHLIPLTLNRSRRVLSSTPMEVSRGSSTGINADGRRRGLTHPGQ